MANYTPSEIVDILLVFGESHRNYKKNASHLYAQRYPDRHPSPQQIINKLKENLVK